MSRLLARRLTSLQLVQRLARLLARLRLAPLQLTRLRLHALPAAARGPPWRAYDAWLFAHLPALHWHSVLLQLLQMLRSAAVGHPEVPVDERLLATGRRDP